MDVVIQINPYFQHARDVPIQKVMDEKEPEEPQELLLEEEFSNCEKIRNYFIHPFCCPKEHCYKNLKFCCNKIGTVSALGKESFVYYLDYLFMQQEEYYFGSLDIRCLPIL